MHLRSDSSLIRCFQPLYSARLRRTVLMTLALLLVTSALSAYTIYLKDGSQLIAKGPYTVSNGRAVIVLSTGVSTSISLEEIDVARTEKANEVDYGDVVVLDDSTVQTIPTPKAPEEKQTLSQMIQPAGRDRLERSTTPTNAQPSNDPTSQQRNLNRVPRTPYGAVDIGNQLQQLLRSRGVDQVKLFQGTQRRRILVDIVTNSEASVFRALQASAKALATLADQRPNEVAALELFMSTDRQGRAGQFLMTPERAAELNGAQISPQQFFIRYVEY